MIVCGQLYKGKSSNALRLLRIAEKTALRENRASVAPCHAVEITDISELLCVLVVAFPKIRSHLDPEEVGSSCLRNALYCRMRTVRYAEHHGERL